ncbi:hypothetical protein [Nitrobacter sp. 62-13]|jgi:hypothetical protein|nr:hypothetical protein [Nitrobacter sp. 62-13]
MEWIGSVLSLNSTETSPQKARASHGKSPRLGIEEVYAARIEDDHT